MDNNEKQSIKNLLGGKKKKIVIKKSAPGTKAAGGHNILDELRKVKDEKKDQAAVKKPEPVKKPETAKQPEPVKKPEPVKPAAKKPPVKKPAPPAAEKKPRTPRISFEIPDKKARRKPSDRPQGGGQGRPGGGQGGGGGADSGFKTPGQIDLARSGFKAPKRPQTFNKRKTKKREQPQKVALPKKQSAPKSRVSIPKEIEILENISVGDLARKLNVKASELIGKLMKMGVMGTINEVIDSDTATLLAEEFECKVKLISLYDETIIEEQKGKEEDLESRAPIITVMGHVDHGKTKLLDYIRKQDVISTEAGGITQHIGAYKVHTTHGDIVFLDTPGHEAFTAMRARGSSITDIVVLVVAADDGPKPQTVEAINHAKAAEVPIIVAINKIDKPEANPDKVRESLSGYDLVPEEWGGQTQYVEISALKGTNVDKLLEAISLQAEVLELKANPEVNASGTVVEARLDPGRGPVATVLIQRGTLHQGSPIVVGRFNGKVRAIFNDREKRLKECGPSTPVEILGIEGVPDAGDPFQEVDSEKEAKNVSSKRIELDRHQQSRALKPMSLDDLNDMVSEGEVKELNVIVKGDVRGSVEAICESLLKLNGPGVKINIKHAQTGGIIESDVMLASASNAIILGFHVRPNQKATLLSEKEGVQVKYYSVIYSLIEDIEKAMHGLLEPTFEEVVTGSAEVRELFKISKVGTISGTRVINGKIFKKNQARVVRDGVVIYEGGIKSLRRVKDDVNEVAEGFECGIFLESFNDLEEGDIIESFEMQEVPAKL